MTNIPYRSIEGQTPLGMPRSDKMILALNEAEGCSSFEFKHYLQSWTHKWKDTIILYPEP
jgi:hypothetical protein